MRKLLTTILIILMLASVLILSSCAAGEALSGIGKILGFVKPLIEDHVHSPSPMLDVESTCMEHGRTGGMMCATCGEILVEPTEAPLAPHRYDGDDDATCNICNYERFCLHRNTKKIAGRLATCKEKGLTEGEICLDCDATIVLQQEIPPTPHTYGVLEAVESTCFSHGKTEGRYCTACKEILVPQQEAPLKNHTYSSDNDITCNVCPYTRDCDHSQTVTLAEKEASCTQTGLTEGKQCSDCGEIVLPQTVIAVKPHSEATITGTPATCIKTGFTSGKICSVCGEITEAQTIIPTTSHTWGSLIPEVAATTSATGTKAHYECSGCDAVSLNGSTICSMSDLVIQNIANDNDNNDNNDNNSSASVGLKFTSNRNGTCYVSGVGTCTDTDIVIPPISPTGDLVTGIGDAVFRGCSSLTSIEIPDSVTSIGKVAFYDCDNLKDVYYTGSVENWCNISFSNSDSNPMCSGDNLYFDGELVTEIVIPDTVNSIKNFAFSYCSSITSIEIPDSVTSIGEDAFSHCTGITSIDIPNSVTRIGEGAFCYCKRLASITIPFVGATKYGESDTEFGHIFGASAYFNNADYVPSSLKSVVITGGTRIDAFAFSECDNLTSVTIPDSVTSIGDEAFEGCKSLTSIVIPDSVTSIGDEAFYHCDSFTSVVIGDSVETIGKYAFAWCDNLSEITLGESLKVIGDYEFFWCESLTSIKYRGTQSQWNSISKGSYWDYKTGNYTITYNYTGE